MIAVFLSKPLLFAGGFTLWLSIGLFFWAIVRINK